MPGTKHTINLSFEPKNMGAFNQVMELSFLKGTYKIPLKLLGTSNSIAPKEKLVGGPQAVKEDFEPNRNFVSAADVEIAPNKGTGHSSTGIPKFL